MENAYSLVCNMWKVHTRPTSASDFFLSSFIRRNQQAQIFNFWTSTFEKISKILNFFEFFGHFFDLRGRGVAIHTQNFENL
jgi:hypothetical protein